MKEKVMLFNNGKLCGFLGNEKKFYGKGKGKSQDLFIELEIHRLL